MEERESAVLAASSAVASAAVTEGSETGAAREYVCVLRWRRKVLCSRRQPAPRAHFPLGVPYAGGPAAGLSSSQTSSA